MSYYNINKNEEDKDKLKSGIITAAVWAAILLFLFIYKVTTKLPEKQEVVTRMLINFGDNRNGNGAEEPANQDGSLAAVETTKIEQPQPEPKSAEKAEPQPVKVQPKETPKERIITGTSSKVSTKKATETSNKTTAKPKATTSGSKTATKSSSSTKANSTSGTGDGKGTAAIGNLIRGKGTKAGTQGTNGTVGNAGDPLGGAGNGDSKVGIDRKLVGFIPGTMGRGGSQPTHNCSASGNIVIAYTVDKAGNVVSARRSSGVSDPCIVSTTVFWVKKYVKAEKAPTSSTGTYKITF